MEKIKLLLSGRQRIENYVRAVEAVGAVAVADTCQKLTRGMTDSYFAAVMT